MRDASINYITRTIPPTRQHKEPYGTVWKVTCDKPVFYIQINRIAMQPKWMRLGVFLEVALEDLLRDELFIKKCLGLYQLHKH